MKKYMKYSLILLSLTILTGCGGSGPTPSEQPTTSTTVTTPTTTETYQGVKAIGGANAGQGRVANGQYLYSYNGIDVDVTSSGMTAGSVVDMTSNGRRTVIGGSTYSYSRFGAIAPASDLTQAEMFYMGTKTTNVPTTGSANYNGRVIKDDLTNTVASFSVDFAQKTINGSAGDITFTNGAITGADFAGDVSGNGQFKGSFFGNGAAELGGTGSSNGNSFSFGAKKL
jgi:hypothetical protein